MGTAVAIDEAILFPGTPMPTDLAAAARALALRARRGPAAFTVDPEADDPTQRSWVLRLWGPVPVGWAGNLSLHCYAAALGVEAGEATRVEAGRWAAALRLRAEKEAAPEGQDFLRMAMRRARVVPAGDELVLRAASVEGGAEARVRVRAPDRLGLLAWLLDRFARVGLHPTRLSVRTEDGEARDVFALAGEAGEAPSRAALEALEADLRSRLRPGAPALR